MSYDVLLLGSYFCDLVYTGLPEFPALGREVYGSGFELRAGAGFYTALALTRLGVRCGWVCDFGDDLFSHFVLERCRQEGIDGALFFHHPFPVRRVTSAISFPHERAFVSYADPPPLPPLEEARRTAALLAEHRPRWLLLPHLSYGPHNEAMFAAARAGGVQIFMDCQHNPATLETPGVAEALRQVQVFAPNQSEALALTGSPTPAAALEKLSTLAPLVLLKCGPDGALARRGAQVVRSPALPVTQVQDTTGAGDCFNAGFLWAALQDLPLERCLEAGNRCGAWAVSGRSPTDPLCSQ